MNNNTIKTFFVKAMFPILFIIPCIIIVSAIKSRHERETFIRTNSPEAFANHNRETVAQWKQYTYIP